MYVLQSTCYMLTTYCLQPLHHALMKNSLKPWRVYRNTEHDSSLRMSSLRCMEHIGPMWRLYRTIPQQWAGPPTSDFNAYYILDIISATAHCHACIPKVLIEV